MTENHALHSAAVTNIISWGAVTNIVIGAVSGIKEFLNEEIKNLKENPHLYPKNFLK